MDIMYSTVAVLWWLLALISKPSQLEHVIELWLTHPHRPAGTEGLRSPYGVTKGVLSITADKEAHRRAYRGL